MVYDGDRVEVDSVMGSPIQAGGLIRNEHVAMISLMDFPSQMRIGRRLLLALGEEGINVELVVHVADLEGRDHLVLCVDRDDLPQALEIAERVGEENAARPISSDPDVALISLFVPDLHKQPGIAGCVFEALGRHDIDIRGVSTSLSTVSCLIRAGQLEDAIRALREAFVFP